MRARLGISHACKRPSFETYSTCWLVQYCKTHPRNSYDVHRRNSLSRETREREATKEKGAAPRREMLGRVFGRSTASAGRQAGRRAFWSAKSATEPAQAEMKSNAAPGSLDGKSDRSVAMNPCQPCSGTRILSVCFGLHRAQLHG